MKWLLIPATALGLVLAVPSMAAPPDQNRDRQQKRTHTTTQQQQQQQNPPSMQRRAPRQQMAPRQQVAPRQQTAPRQRVAPRNKPARTRATQQQYNRFDWNKYQPGKSPAYMKRNPRIDMYVWHRNYRAEKRFHWRPYRKPHGWYYRRWVFGMILPTLFWERDYWIVDYWDFGLPNPPYGYVWVRYGDDALLINVRSGYILQVIYDLFD